MFKQVLQQMGIRNCRYTLHVRRYSTHVLYVQYPAGRYHYSYSTAQ